MASPFIGTQRIILPPLPDIPASARSGTIELPPLADAKLVAARRNDATSATVQPGPNKSTARTLSAPFRAIRNAFRRLGDLIAENQAARKQQVLQKNVQNAASKFAKAVGPGTAATIEDKLQTSLALMKAARRLNGGKPEDAAVQALLAGGAELNASDLRQLSMDLYGAAYGQDRHRISAANGEVAEAYGDPESATRQTDALMGALRAAFVPTDAQQRDADTERKKVHDTVCGTFGKKSADDLAKVRSELTTYLAGEGVNAGNVLRDIKLPAADNMTRFLDANDSPAYRGEIVASFIEAAALDTPLPLENATSGPKLVPSLLSPEQVSVMLGAAKSMFGHIVGDGTPESTDKAAERLSKPAVKLLQVLDKSLENEGKLNDDVPKLNAFAGTLFLRHVCPALVAVRTNSVSNQALQQESAVAVFLTAFIQAAANQAGAGKLAAGMSAECQDLVQKALEDCAGPLKAFKQAVMDRQIEA